MSSNTKAVKIEKKRRIQDMLQESFFSSCMTCGILKHVISVHQDVTAVGAYDPSWSLTIEVENTSDTQKVHDKIISDIRKEYDKFIKDVLRMDLYVPMGKRYRTVFIFK